MDIFRRDLVLALRGLRQAPGVTAAVVVMLALAIGATAGVSSVVHAALQRPLPYFDVDRWADLYERPINEGLDTTLSVSIPNYRDWRDGSRAFTAMVLWRPWSFNLAGDDRAPGAAARDDRHAEPVRRAAPRPGGRAAAAGHRRTRSMAGVVLHQPSAVAAPLRWRSGHRRPGDPAEPRAAHRGRRGAAGFTFPLDGPVDVWVPGLDARRSPRDTYRDARGLQVSGAAPRRRHVGGRARRDGPHRRPPGRHPSRGSRLRRDDHADARVAGRGHPRAAGDAARRARPDRAADRRQPRQPAARAAGRPTARVRGPGRRSAPRGRA